MSRKEFIFVASRLFALLLLVLAMIVVTYLPEQLFALFKLGQRSVLAGTDQMSKYHLTIVIFAFVRIVGLLIAASWFWRCGRKIEQLFWAESNNELK
jgi:hypothetical protein